MTRSFGLMAAMPIHWLLTRERDVRLRVEAFAADQAAPIIDVAGPPSVEEMLKARAHPRRPVHLPTIRLHLRKVRHHLTGAPGIEVKCSDADMDLIVAWARQSRARAALAADPVRH